MKTQLITLIDEQITRFSSYIKNPSYPTETEQNAALTTLRTLQQIKNAYESEPQWIAVVTPSEDASPANTPLQKAIDDVSHFGNLLSFIERVGEMRTAQKNFFKMRGKATEAEIRKWLGESKRLEREVDELLTKFNERNSAQQKLF